MNPFKIGYQTNPSPPYSPHDDAIDLAEEWAHQLTIDGYITAPGESSTLYTQKQIDDMDGDNLEILFTIAWDWIVARRKKSEWN